MMNRPMNYNRTPLVDVGRNVTMSAETICNTLREIADLMGENKPNADELKSIYHLREHDSTRVVHLRKHDGTVSILRFAPNRAKTPF